MRPYLVIQRARRDCPGVQNLFIIVMAKSKQDAIELSGFTSDNYHVAITAEILAQNKRYAL